LCRNNVRLVTVFFHETFGIYRKYMVIRQKITAESARGSFSFHFTPPAQ